MKIYRIDYLIEQMALQKGGSVSDIRAALQAELGVSRAKMIRLRRATVDNECPFSIDHMIKAAHFFGCKVDDLLNMPAIEKIK